jgi:hypothetical protein
MVDPPKSDDERYRRQRVDGFEAVLRVWGEPVSRAAIDRAYHASGRFLASVWSELRDVGVGEHVRAILAAIDRALPSRLPASATAALVEAYGAPILVVPPAVDARARAALDALSRRGYVLAVISNTMRTPGVVLRRVLERQGLWPTSRRPWRGWKRTERAERGYRAPRRRAMRRAPGWHSATQISWR